MPDPSKVHSSSLSSMNFNLLLFFNFLVSFIGSIFLAWNGVQGGLIYSFMYVGILSTMFLVLFFLKDDDKLKPITNFVKIPIATKLTLATFFYMLGILIPFIINSILKSTLGLSIISFSVPLFGLGIATGTQSFATATIGNSMAWKIYSLMFVAGNLETLVFNFGLVLVFVLVGVFILKLINGGKDLPFISKKNFVLSFAFIMTAILFMLSHIMNKSYGGKEFIIAGIFLLIANISIYIVGVFLTFWAGFHQSNNLIFLIELEGIREVLNGFISWFGAIFLVYIALIIFFIITNWSQIWKDLTTWGSA